MNTGIQALSEREKDALRLLLVGHDAKSIARSLGLSVHTVNERLRGARRKLQVSSSREAARLLGEAEHWTPNYFGDKQIGVAPEGAYAAWHGTSHQSGGRGRVGLMLLGGTLIMSLVVAAVLLSSALTQSSGTASALLAPSSAASVSAAQSAAAKSAREWVALVDAQKWEQSWRSAGSLFKAQLTAGTWTAAVQPVRKPLGAVSSRVLQSATEHSSLPGAPAGEYEMIEFKTAFANKKDAVETLVLAHERSGWKVVGYFIR